MKTFLAGLVLLLVFMVTDNSNTYAGSEHCTKDFWGKCQGSSWRHNGFRYRHCAKDFWGRCADGRPRWRHNGHGNGHWQGRGEVDRGAFCHPRRRIVGIEQTSKSRARRAADDAWMGAVRYDHGERFQDLNHAKDVRHNCDPSTPVSPAVVIKKTYFRCVVEATPCRAPTGTTEETYERRYEEEAGDDDKD